MQQGRPCPCRSGQTSILSDESQFRRPHYWCQDALLSNPSLDYSGFNLSRKTRGGTFRLVASRSASRSSSNTTAPVRRADSGRFHRALNLGWEKLRLETVTAAKEILAFRFSCRDRFKLACVPF